MEGNMINFIQITAHDGEVFALDNAGFIWRFHAADSEWELLPPHPIQKMEAEDAEVNFNNIKRYGSW